MPKYTLHLTIKHVALPPEREFAYRHSLSLLTKLLPFPKPQTEDKKGLEVHTPSIPVSRVA